MRAAVGQTADRLIKPSSRDPSLKPTRQIQDKDGERQIDAGWGCVKGAVKLSTIDSLCVWVRL